PFCKTYATAVVRAFRRYRDECRRIERRHDSNDVLPMPDIASALAAPTSEEAAESMRLARDSQVTPIGDTCAVSVPRTRLLDVVHAEKRVRFLQIPATFTPFHNASGAFAAGMPLAKRGYVIRLTHAHDRNRRAACGDADRCVLAACRRPLQRAR